MKKFLLLIIGFWTLVNVRAENYANEWINTSLKYYKFKVAKEGIYRIPKSTLIQAGISSSEIIGKNVRLILNGQEVPVYVTTDDEFGDTDYIEFYGKELDGSFDTQLYLKPEYQPNPYRSLYTDSATYFLTFNTQGVGKRITAEDNDLTNLPPKEIYCWGFSRNSFLDVFSASQNPSILLTTVHSSAYDLGEGFVSQSLIGKVSKLFYFDSKSRYSSDTSIKANIKGRIVMMSKNEHGFVLNVQGAILDTLTPKGQGLLDFSYQFRSSALNLSATPLTLRQLNSDDVSSMSWIEARVPETYNFSGLNTHSFGIDKKQDSYIEISGFRSGSGVILYDLRNSIRYQGIVNNTITKFHFKPTTGLKDSLYISNQDSTIIRNITELNTVNFPEINEGKYIIISSKKLKFNSDGTDYVKAYADYRSSAKGGHYQVATYYIDELENEFAYGIKNHPLAIRNFINYLIDKAQVKPELVFIIGKGYEYSRKRNSSDEFLQTYGQPASDNLLVARSSTLPYPQVGVGRLSARNSDEIKVYLDKMKTYEEEQQTHGVDDQTLENKEWMKSVLHLAGGNFVDEQATFARYLTSYEKIIEGPYFGANVHSVYKNSTDPVQVAQSAIIDSMQRNGTSLITFFGHSSTSDLDFDIEPENFKNVDGKYPFMLTNGCFVGNIFGEGDSYSERFVLLPKKAAIAYLAPMTYAIAYSLNQYTTNFYNRLGVTEYGKPIGKILKDVCTDILGSTLQTDVFIGQQMIFHGDPALKLNSFDKPDYILTNKQVFLVPEVVNASVDTFQIGINQKNIGKSIDTTYKILVQRTLPNGNIETYEQVVKAPLYSDTVYISIPTNNIEGLGENKFYIKLESDDAIDELSENNNEVNLTEYFTIDDLLPVSPSEFSIVNKPNINLLYTSANPLIGERKYIVQIDTTELFNSPILTSEILNDKGGIINWQPSIPLINNTVYYWRGSLDTIYNNKISWNKSSFLYNTGLSEGWNQSHYFQFLPDNYNSMLLKDNRQFSFIESIRNFKVVNGTDSLGFNHRMLFANNNLISRNAYARQSMMFYVLDTKTGQAMTTYQVGNTGLGQYGNTTNTPLTDVKIIEFNTAVPEGRLACYNFIKNIIPDKSIIVGYSFQNAYYSKWAADTALPGFNGESLFDAFESIGVTDIRNVQEFQPFVFYTQKGNPSFPTQQIIKDRSQIIDVSFTYVGTWNRGSMSSPLIGPALKWNTSDYNWTSLDQPITDQVKYNLYGYSNTGDRQLLKSDFPKNVDISDIDASIFPYLQLELDAEDEGNSTSPQLDYWRVIYEEAPEGVMNPKKHLVTSGDTVSYGATYKAEIAFENITDVGMDSVLVKFTVRDANNNSKSYYKRFAPLPGKQYLVINFEYTFDKPENQGTNTIIFEANPDNDQKEKYHFNNFAFFTISIAKDNMNPLMDVTFDGRHITDGEIVSPKPEILIKLKDENKNLALNDTSMFTLYLKTPTSTTPIALDPRSSEFSFVPADETKIEHDNEAKLFYRPNFVEDGTYELSVQGRDRSANVAGTNDYKIQFKVDTRPAISNILNYPNPFSTSTQFIFTVTGIDPPTDLKIQILTVSGKVVKEITAEELGDIHIGVNRTTYKWDGTDMYGDRLANGLYFYRVTAKIDGKRMDMIASNSVDKYFKKGFGKMYIVR